MFLGTQLFWALKQSKWQLFSKADIFLITSISSPYTKVVHKSRQLFQFGRGSYCCQCFCFSSGPNSDVVAPGSSCTSIFDSCSKCCLACDTKFKVCFNGHKKKVHNQIIQDETDGPFLWLCLAKTGGEFTAENKGFSFNQQWMVGSQSSCQCYFMMAAQRKQLSMVCNSLRGQPCAGWTMFFGSLKRAGDRATGILHFTQQQYRLQQNFWQQINPKLFHITSYKLLVREMAAHKWHIPHPEVVSCILLGLN